MITEILTGVSEWGPGALLTVLLLLFAWLIAKGKIIPVSTHEAIVKALEKIVVEKERVNAELKLYYEGRISDIQAAHAERGADLRHVSETNARALQVSVDNVQKLLIQNDELLEIARVAAPAVLAVRRAVEVTDVTE